MFPIDGPGATVDNKFTEGDPIGGVPATVVTAKFMNDVQAELLSIMAASIPPQAPSTSLQNQVLAAIQLLIAAAVAPIAKLPRGYFSGFTLTNNVGAPNTTVDVGPGSARDSTDTVDITLTSTLSGILQSSGAWAAGNNQNKLDTGAKAINSDYHKFVIQHPTQADDILYSLSPTAPTMPSGYSGFRRVGHISTDSSGNIRAFKDRGDGYFDLVTPIVQIVASAATPGTSPLTLVGVGGAPALVKLQVACGGDGVSTKIIPTDVTNSANTSLPTTWTGGILMQAGGGSAFEAASGELEVRSDTSKQVTLRTYAAAGTIDFQVLLMGWRVLR